MGFYTDLALEAREAVPGDNREIRGVILEKHDLGNGLGFTYVEIQTEEGAKVMGKPKGVYLTLEGIFMDEEAQRAQCIQYMVEGLKNLLPKAKKNVLVVGLGNRNFSADALGPKVVEHLHLPEDQTMMAFVPGVFAYTGMETARMVRGVVKEYRPDALIVADSLAARNVERLTSTIQMSNVGIRPGSGVGNHRVGLYQEELDIPVIAIGIPMVVSAQTLAGEKKGLEGLYVTPRDIEEQADFFARLIAEGICQFGQVLTTVQST